MLLSGMTGTCREVASEVAEVYFLDTLRVPPRRPNRRRTLPSSVYATSAEKWQAVCFSIQKRLEKGQSVLVGTRSVLSSEILSSELAALGIAHAVINAKQDEQEADVVAKAGGAGSVTIATSMAGRGTDIELVDAVRAAGGLHVILTELHDNARVDRQLVGRCARQGDPGSCERILSMDDEVLRGQLGWLVTVTRSWLAGAPNRPVPRVLALGLHRFAQWRLDRTHARARRALLKTDIETRRSLSFSGQME